MDIILTAFVVVAFGLCFGMLAGAFWLMKADADLAEREAARRIAWLRGLLR